MTKLIINADDFGLTESCSTAIAKAFSENLISSTTACANGDYIEQSYNIARDNGFLDKIGIHINLTEGKPLTDDIKTDAFFCKNGVFHGHINRLKRPTKNQINELKEEITAQIERLKNIGFDLTHADSHHHIHTCVFLENTIKDVLFSYGIKKIRLHRNFGDIKFYKRIVKRLYNNKLHKQGFITTDKMGSVEDLEKYPDIVNKGICEIMVHPDFDKNGRLIDRIGWDEEGYPFGKELSEIKKYIKDYQQISYGEL